MTSPLQVLLDLVDEAFDHKAWHGTTLLGSIRGVTAARAAWRPAPRRHNIWELSIHAAYWKYAVRRRLSGGKRGTFAFVGSNWFARPEDPHNLEREWKNDVRLLIHEHRRLREVIAALEPGVLARRSADKRRTPLFMIRGIAAHDLYHAGQIQLLKRLQE